jgi:hypothetical protein
MKRIAMLSLCTLLLTIAARSDTVNLTNQFGSVTITSAGIDTTHSELTAFAFNWRKAPLGHNLGSLSFSTGALIEGTLFGGGIFSSNDSNLVATGLGKYGVPKGTIFAGSFEGPITWTLESHTGNNYVFDLIGSITGTLFNGRRISGSTEQTIYLNQNSLYQNQRGTLHSGTTRVAMPLSAGPEPDTLLLSATGVAIIIAATRRRGRIRA